MAEQLKHYDLYSPQNRANPQAMYKQMRNDPYLYSEMSTFGGFRFWVLTRYDECIDALKDPRIGKEVWKHRPPGFVETYTAPTDGSDALDRHLLNIDPPDHTRLRGLVHKAFTPHIVENLRPRIEQISNDLLDSVMNDGAMDLIADFGFPLPITVIAELLGIPAENRDQFRTWTKQLLFAKSQEEYVTAVTEFVSYMSGLLDQRRVEPRDDLLSNLLAVKDHKEKLDEQELLSMIMLLLVAGHETTVNLIGNGILALLQHPEQLWKLQEQPGLIHTALEEILRFNGPVETGTMRFAFEDIPLRNSVIKHGDGVLIALLSANRDPDAFEKPDTFDISRQPNRHIAFGNGIHYCLGAPLARLEGEIAINTLLRRLPELNLAPGAAEALEWSDSILIHGLKALPVCY